MTINKAYKEAREHFGLKPGDGLCLHHVDSTLRHTNRKRYNEWRPEDLIVMTKAEHTRLHHKGKKRSEEHVRKMSEVRKGRKRPPFSEEHRRKIGEGNQVSVAQYTMDNKLVRVWCSLAQAEREGGFSKSKICLVCQNKRRHHKNYIWKYVNDKT